MTLDEARALVGARVLYRSGTGRPAPARVEGVNSHWVLVRFAGSPIAQQVDARYLTSSGPARVSPRRNR